MFFLAAAKVGGIVANNDYPADFIRELYVIDTSSYNMFAVNGILFNHESVRRGETFVTRKILLAVARITQGKLGNLDSLRDWGYAKDYVECMWLMLQHEIPEDFVIATAKMHTVREFVELAFENVNIEFEWVGKGQ